ncbi:SPOR domain-containing protein [Marinobacter sp. SS21]|uniref:SPOR domain-containing protein n=1 Tax=Marinobacter sp. SS21 TaxID=2979460 RepID=UPI0023311D40|nr:SPOR domain-containing protein [Marinobacter sp. SS21]MDC0662433.1 SPOR domain-containing protein [Marinobacter sp. SS21]
MSNQDRQPSKSEEELGQPPLLTDEASTQAEPPLVETVVEESNDSAGVLVALSEDTAERRFAHDINAKIDEVEGQVQFLVEAFARSQQALKGVMGDVKSQTALVTSEIERVLGLMDQASAEQVERVAALDQRLKTTVAELTGRLAGVDDQLHAHQNDIGALKAGLDDSHARLSDKIQDLAADTQRQLDQLVSQDERLGQELVALAEETARGLEQGKRERQALAATQQEHQSQQQTMAGHLERLQDQADGQGEALTGLEATVAEQHQDNRHQHRRFAWVGAAVVVLFAAVLTYLELAPSAEFEQLQAGVSGIENQAGDIERQMAGIENQVGELESRVQVADTTAGVVVDLGDQMTALEAQIGSLSAELQAADASESLEAIANKVAALELSVYGPADAEPSATPVLTIENARWVAGRNPSHYSIQLLGAYREGSLVAFSNQHADALGQHPLSQTQSEYRGRSWYNLFYGDFARFDDAQAALKALPSHLQRNGPWIRTLSSIQQSSVR